MSTIAFIVTTRQKVYTNKMLVRTNIHHKSSLCTQAYLNTLRFTTYVNNKRVIEEQEIFNAMAVAITH